MNINQKYILLSLVLSLLVLSSCKKDNPADQGTTTPVPVKVPLLAPGNLQLISLSATEAKVRWTDNSTNETSFIIEQSTDNANFITAKTVAANVDSTVVSGTFLTVNTYYFRVKATNADTTTGASNVVNATLLSAPGNLEILAFTPGSVSLRWSDNSANETGFLIERRIDSAQYAVIDSTGSNTTTKTVSGTFESSRTYSFRIVARTGAGKSAHSNATARTLGSWVFVTGGTFQMGRADGYNDERPVHTVTLSHYYISKYEVTVKEYRAYTTAAQLPFPAAPPGGWNDNHPMVNVSWNDAAAYCAWMDSASQKGVRLPTEAEWEYAARGGANTQKFKYSGSNTIDDVAWYYLNSNNGTSPAGTKQPNELGIYDMSGNAFEWCSDWSGSYSYLAQTNPKGPAIGGTFKVFRGGSWFNYGLAENDCRVETRYAYTPANKTSDSGFRIVKPF